MFLALVREETKTMIEIEVKDIEPFVEVLKGATIIDDEGGLWTIDPAEKLYFDLFHFSCGIHNPGGKQLLNQALCYSRGKSTMGMKKRVLDGLQCCVFSQSLQMVTDTQSPGNITCIEFPI